MVSDDVAIAQLRAEIERSFERYATYRGITSIVFYWAGAEVPPYIPSTVMGRVYAGTRLVGDCVGGFEPFPLTLLDETAADDEARVAAHLAKSLELATRAVA